MNFKLELVEELASKNFGDLLAVSVYLDVSGRAQTKDQYRTLLHSMLDEKQKELAELGLSHKQEGSLRKDFVRIREYVENQFLRNATATLVLFSCSEAGFFRELRLGLRAGSHLNIAPDLFVRPLSALVDEYERIGVLIEDREKASFFEVFMGQVEDRTDVFDEVPARARHFAGWYGLEDKRAHDHIEWHVGEHLKHVSESLFRHFQQHYLGRHGFDSLVIAGHAEILPQVEKSLHPYLRQRIIDRLRLGPESGLPRILEKVIECGRRREREQESALLDDLEGRLGRGEPAAAGPSGTLGAISKGQVETLLVDESPSAPGYICNECGVISEDSPVCRSCSRRTQPVPDLIDGAIQMTLKRDGKIRHFPGGGLERFGHIAALLRFSF